MSGKVGYLWKKFLLTVKHAYQRFIIRMRRIINYQIPKQVMSAIDTIWKETCIIYTLSADSSVWESGVEDIINKHKREYDLLFNNDIEYSKDDYMSVDTKVVVKDLIIANKQLELTSKRYLVYENELKKHGSPARVRNEFGDNFMYTPECMAFFKKLFTLQVQVLTKYFTFGKVQGKDELLEIGTPIEAQLVM